MFMTSSATHNVTNFPNSYLDELWISYNNIEKLKGIHVLKKLRILYMSNNNVKVTNSAYTTSSNELARLPLTHSFQDWGEFSKLADLPMLQELTFNGNPLEVTMQADGDYLDKGPV